VPLIVFAGPLIGIIGIIIAVPTGLPTAYVYERGENTIWGDALVHAGTNMPALIFTFAPDVQPIAASVFFLVGIVDASAIVLWAYRNKFAGLTGAPATPARSSIAG